MKNLFIIAMLACIFFPQELRAQKTDPSREKLFSLSNKVYGIEDSPGIGTKEFNVKFNEKMAAVKDWSKLFDYFILQSDKSGHAVRFRYLEKEVEVVYLIQQEEGLVVLKTIFRKDQNSKNVRVIESCIYRLDGTLLPSEDLVPIDDKSYWRKSEE